MDEAPNLLTTAVQVVLQFGPERRRPESERLSEQATSASSEDRAAALKTAHEIADRAYAITPRPDEGLSEQESRGAFRSAVATLGTEYPALSEDLRVRVVNQANYWHFRD